MTKSTKALASIGSGLLLFLGLADVPDQVSKWKAWATSLWRAVMPFVNSETARWLFVITGVLLLLFAWWPRRKNGQSGSSTTTPELISLLRPEPRLTLQKGENHLLFRFDNPTKTKLLGIRLTIIDMRLWDKERKAFIDVPECHKDGVFNPIELEGLDEIGAEHSYTYLFLRFLHLRTLILWGIDLATRDRRELLIERSGLWQIRTRIEYNQIEKYQLDCISWTQGMKPVLVKDPLQS